tara:strand:- start:443 stop:940 length:498 start_codon:yes stop_codon:yes gene_type:complete
MTGNSLQERAKYEVAKDFRTTVTKLEADLKNIADGEVIFAGTEENPILTDNKQIPINHFFMDGVYVREMRMKKGLAIIGAIHKHLHMCFLLEGHVSVANENETVDYVAPCYIVSTPGIKRVLYAHEESVWYNIHKNPSSTEDVRELEGSIVALTYEEYEEYIKNK